MTKTTEELRQALHELDPRDRAGLEAYIYFLNWRRGKNKVSSLRDLGMLARGMWLALMVKK